MATSPRVWIVSACALLVAGLAGCTVRTETVPVATVEGPPVDSAPHTVYEGRNVYYHRGHWYYRDGAAWRYYQDEPPELVRQRSYVQEAPPAYPQRPYAPPPVYTPPPSEAPPAVRVGP